MALDVKISGVSYKGLDDYSIQQQAGAIATTTVGVTLEGGNPVPQAGERVELILNSVTIFGGLIKTVETAEFSTGHEVQVYRVTVQSWEVALTYRLVTGTWYNKTYFQIITEIFTNIIAEENFTLGGISTTVTSIPKYDVKDRTVYDVLSDIAAKIGPSNFWITPAKVFWFRTAADFTSTTVPTKLTGLRLRTDLSDMRTVQRVRGASSKITATAIDSGRIATLAGLSGLSGKIEGVVQDTTIKTTASAGTKATAELTNRAEREQTVDVTCHDLTASLPNLTWTINKPTLGIVGTYVVTERTITHRVGNEVNVRVVLKNRNFFARYGYSIKAIAVAADNSTDRISDMDSDEMLTPVEKAVVRNRWDAIIAERPILQADGAALTTLLGNYNTAFQILANLLNDGVTWTTGLPTWISTDQMATYQPISTATWDPAWTNYQVAKDSLLSGISTANAEETYPDSSALFAAYAFEGIPDITYPDNAAGTTYAQDLWATVDSWAGTNASMDVATESGVNRVTTSTTTGYIQRAISFSSGQLAILRVKNVSGNGALVLQNQAGTVRGSVTIPGSDWIYVSMILSGTGTALRILPSNGATGRVDIDGIYLGDGSCTWTVGDDSGNGRTLTPKGNLSRVTGRSGKALRFDGATGSASGTLSGFTDKITVSFWEYFEAFTSATKILIETSTDSTANTGAFRFLQAVSGIPGELAFRLKTATGNFGFRYQLSSAGLHHLSLEYDRTITSNDALKLYIDGVQVTLTYDLPYSGAGTLPTLYNGAFYVHSRAGTTLHADGWMDELRFDSRALSDAGHRALHSSPMPGTIALVQSAQAEGLAYADALAANLQTQVDRAIVFYNAVADPSGAWTAQEKLDHIGDYWRLTSTTAWSTWSGTAWTALPDAAAQTTANTANTLAGKKSTLWASLATANTAGNGVIGDSFLDSGLLYRCTVNATSITLANSTRLTAKRYADVANTTARNALTGMIVNDTVYQSDTLQWYYYNGSAWVDDGAALPSVVQTYNPVYFGKYLDSSPTTTIVGSIYTRYSTTSGTTNRGVFRWSGSAWVRTEAAGDINQAMADISFIIAYKNTAGTAIYGTAADYTSDPTLQASFAFFQSAMIGFLQANDIQVLNDIRGGGRYNADGSLADGTKSGFWLGATGACKVAGITFEGSQGGGVQWGGPSQIGSGLAMTAFSNVPALAILNSTDVVFFDKDNMQLKVYRWGGESWTQLGSAFTVTGATNPSSMTALNSTDIAFADSTNDQIKTYRWNGSTWSLIGSALSVTMGAPSITALNSTDIAFVDSSNNQIRTYRWNGSTWSQVGSGFAIPTPGFLRITALSQSSIALIYANSQLRTYQWNGSVWAQEGSGLTITGTGVASLTALNGTDVAMLGTDDKLRVYRWDGSVWTNVGSAGQITISSGFSALTSFNGTDIVMVDDFNEELRVYRISFSLSIPYSRQLTG